MTAERQSPKSRTLLSLALLTFFLLAPSVLSTHNAGSITKTNAVLPLPVAHTSAVWDGQRYGYVFGGYAGSGILVRSIVRYDPATDAAAALPAQLPTARMGTSAVWDSRSLPGIGCTGGCAYIFGGDEGGGTPLLDEIVWFNPDSASPQVLSARLPHPRFGSTAVWTGVHAYILGGGTDDLEPRRDIIRFDPLTKEVTVVGAQLPFTMHFASAVWDPRDRPSAGCASGCIYVFGGSTEEEELDSIVQYAPATDTIRLMQVKLPSARMWTAAAWDGTHAYIFGGDDANGQALGDVLRYDPVSNRIDLLTPVLDPRRDAASVIWAGTNAYTFGGENNRAEKSADILRFHPPPANNPPVAAFTAAITHLGASVDASGSTDADQDTLSFSWDWGDGSTGSGATATHSYTAGGSYTIRLTVRDPSGASATATRTVTAQAPPPPPNQLPVASFVETTDALRVIVDASGSTDPDGSVVSYQWQWGDGQTSSGMTNTHTYSSAGTRTIRLTVTDDDGATASTTRSVTLNAPPPPAVNQAPVAAFTSSLNALSVNVDASTSSDPEGPVASYAWDWGDGATGNGVRATYTYANPGAFTIRLTVADADGLTSSISKSITASLPPNQPPTATFTIQASDLNVSVDASTSHNADASITTYTWDWGDNHPTSSGRTAAHTYAAPGAYTIRLTIADNRSATATTTRTISVTAPATPPAPTQNEDPTPAFNATTSGLNVSVDATLSFDSDGTIAAYGWNWGDGTSDTASMITTHTYTNPGTYTIRLTVTDDSGARADATRTVTIKQLVPAAPENHTSESEANESTKEIQPSTTDSDGDQDPGPISPDADAEAAAAIPLEPPPADSGDEDPDNPENDSTVESASLVVDESRTEVESGATGPIDAKNSVPATPLATTLLAGLVATIVLLRLRQHPR